MKLADVIARNEKAVAELRGVMKKYPDAVYISLPDGRMVPSTTQITPTRFELLVRAGPEGDEVELLVAPVEVVTMGLVAYVATDCPACGCTYDHEATCSLRGEPRVKRGGAEPGEPTEVHVYGPPGSWANADAFFRRAREQNPGAHDALLEWWR